MSAVTISGYFLALLGLVLLILNATLITHLNYIWIVLSLIIGFILVYIGGQAE